MNRNKIKLDVSDLENDKSICYDKVVDMKHININCDDLKDDCFAGDENLLDRMRKINDKMSSAKKLEEL